MVGAPAEAPVQPELPDQAPPEEQTEIPAPPVEAESAAETPAEAADLQVEVAEPEKPDYITREEWEREREEIRKQAAADALETDRRRRQTENARKAKQAERDAEERTELIDSIRVAFIEEGNLAPPTEKIAASVDRLVRKRTEQIGLANLELVAQAWDYVTASAFGQEGEWDEAFGPAARTLAPKLQNLVNHIRPQIEAKAREGYISEEELPKRVDAEIAKRNAKAREGQTQLPRSEGAVSAQQEGSPAWWSSIGPEGRKNPANQKLFDDWISRNP